MLDGHKILAIIPARGGSKGLPAKNIKPLLGKPLIGWTIEQAQKSRYIDTVFVNTDDEMIASVAKNFKANVSFLRPSRLAGDTINISDVIVHTLDFFKDKLCQEYDITILLEPTSPLRKPNDIDDALTLFMKYKNTADALVSVGEVYMQHPFITKKIVNNFVMPFVEPEKKIYQRQMLTKAYFPFGVIYLSKTPAFRLHKTFYQERTIPYFIERWQNYEIDDIYDFMAIETILKHKRL